VLPPAPALRQINRAGSDVLLAKTHALRADATILARRSSKVLYNPVISREFITSLRLRRASVLALLYLTALTLLVLLMWPRSGVYSLAAQSSQRLFVTLSTTLLGMISLCAPAFTAVSITREKEQRTYEMLYQSLLGPGQIIIGKFIAGVGVILMLTVASLPMMGACFVLGGVTLAAVVNVYALVLAAGIFFGLLGLFCSAHSSNSYRSLIVCYILILALSVLTWVPSIVLGLWAENVHSIHLIRGLSPFAALIAIINPQRFAAEHPVPPTGFGAFADSPMVFFLVAGAGSLLLLLLTYIQVARPPQPRRHRDVDIIEDRMELIKRHVKFPFYLLDPRKRKRMIGSVLNLIFVKEMRSKAFSRSVWVIRCMYLAMLVSLVMAFLPLTQITKIGIDTVVMTCVALPLGLVLLISPVLTATAISNERESGVFDSLRCTRISARTLVLGKLEVAWFFTTLLLSSTFPTFFVLAYVNCSPSDMGHLSDALNHIRPFNFAFTQGMQELAQVDLAFLGKMGSAFIVVLMSMAFATASGILASCWCRRSSVATAIAYLTVCLWSMGTLVPYILGDNLPQSLLHFSLSINPFVAAASAVSPETFPGLPANLWLNFLVGIGIVTILMIGISWQRIWQMMRPQS